MRSWGIISGLSFLLLFLVLGGCFEPGNDDKYGSYIVPLDSGIVFTVKEGYKEHDAVSKPVVVLSLMTEAKGRKKKLE